MGSQKSEPVSRQARILLVDDRTENLVALDAILSSLNQILVPVRSGEQALQALLAEEFAVVLLDIVMPDMDGFETARRVREDLGLSVPIVLLRSMGSPGDAARRRRVGIHTYLNKPLRQEELLAAISEAVGAAIESPAAPVKVAEQTRKTGSPVRVLLAEDNPVNRMLAVRLLEREGYRIKVTCDGREALAAFLADTFDIALVDIQMPEMDGFEVTASIRRHEAQCGGHLPIVAMTAHAMKGDAEQCRAAGMDGYVSKPIVAALLFEEIETALAAAHTL